MRCIARVIVLIFQSVFLVSGLGPVPSWSVRASAPAPAPVVRRGVGDGDVVARGGATGRLGSWCSRYGRRWWGDSVMLYARTRGRVRGFDLVNVVPPLLVVLAVVVLAIVVFFHVVVVVVVVFLFVRLGVFLAVGRLVVFAIVLFGGARVVVDGDSFPYESDLNVSARIAQAA